MLLKDKLNLTPREFEILQLVILGKSTKKIALELCISEHTVKTHRKNLFEKMNVNGLSSLTLKLHELGYLDELISEEIKVIEFKSKYFQAGLSILTYFKRIVKLRVPELSNKITIKSLGNKVSLLINSEVSKDEKDTILNLFLEYEEVITGKLKPEEILDNENDIRELNNRLVLVSMELKAAEDKINLLESFNDNLYEINQSDRKLNFSLTKLLHDHVEKFTHEKIVDSIIDSLEKDSIKKLSNELKKIRDLISDEDNLEQNKEEITEQVEEIRRKDKGAFSTIKEVLVKASGSGLGKFLYDLICLL